MAGRIVTVAQQKGGAGKTTLLAQLAVAWATEGVRVAAVDVDPQGSLAAWLELRRGNGETGQPIGGGAVTGWRLETVLRSHARDHDIVLIDSPPHASTDVKAAIREADLVLVPCQPSRLDLWATRPTLDLAAAEGREALLVLNRVPARGRAAEEARAYLAELGVPLAEANLGNRTAFARSLGEGKGVCETEARSPAAGEARRLAAEVARRLA